MPGTTGVDGSPVSTGVATPSLHSSGIQWSSRPCWPWQGSIPTPALTTAIMGEERKCLFIINETEGGSLSFLGGVISASRKWSANSPGSIKSSDRRNNCLCQEQRKEASVEWRPLARQVDCGRAEGGRWGSLMTPGKRKKQEGQTGNCKTQVWKDPPEAPLVLLEE